MKNIFRYIASFIVGAMSLAACQQEIAPLGTEISVNPSSVSADGQNAANATVKVVADGDWIAVTPEWISVSPAYGGAGETAVTLSFADNLDADGTLAAARKATVLFSVNAADAELSVEQAGDPDKAPAEVKVVTCAEFVATEDGAGPFKVTGTITNIEQISPSTAYNNGNLTIADETGELYLYRVGPGDGKKLEDLGLAVGDKITVEGKKGSYNNSPQMAQGGVILEVEKSLIKVEKVAPATPLSAEGGVVTVVLDVKGDDIAVEIPEADTWLTAAEPTVIGTSTFVDLTAEINEGNPRSTTVNFTTTSKGQTYVASVTIEQRAGVIPDPEIATIETILALELDTTIEYGTVIEGVVISNTELGNLTSKKGMYVQDATGGLQLRLIEDHTFAFGDNVRIDLSGALFTTYNQAIQVSNIPNANVKVLSSGNEVEAKAVSAADFLENKYEGQYVALENVQVVEADLTKKFVENESHTSISIETADGQNFVVFSSKYASYGETVVPQGSGTLKGISARNNDVIQIIFAQESDFAGLSGERFEAGQPDQPDQPDQPGATTIAELYQQITGTSDSQSPFAVNLKEPAVVTYVKGNSAFIEDATGGILYFKNGHGLSVGQKISGVVEGTGYIYNGVPQISSITNTPAIENGTAPEYPVVTLAEILENYSRYTSCVVKMTGVRIEDGFTNSDRSGKLSQGSDEINVYVQDKNADPAFNVSAGTEGDIICVPTMYNTTKQVGIWEVAHFTPASVVSSISMPETLSLYVEDVKALGATTNSTETITYVSSDPTVAAVDADGKVTALKVGEATITASVAAAGICTAAEATCKVTVSEKPAGEMTWSHTFAKGELGIGEKTLNGIVWKVAMENSTYFGWDSNPTAKGIQMGSSSSPASMVVLSTDDISGTIKSIKVNTSGANGTDGKLNVKVGSESYGSEVSLTTTAATYTFEGTSSGTIELVWTCTAKAMYVKSIEVVYE